MFQQDALGRDPQRFLEQELCALASDGGMPENGDVRAAIGGDLTLAR